MNIYFIRWNCNLFFNLFARYEYMAIKGFTEYTKEDRKKYNRMRWWLGMTWGDMFDKATDFIPTRSVLLIIRPLDLFRTSRQSRSSGNQPDKTWHQAPRLGSSSVPQLARIYPGVFCHAEDRGPHGPAYPETQSVRGQSPVCFDKTGGLDTARPVWQDQLSAYNR